MGKANLAGAYFQKTADVIASRKASQGYINNQFFERTWLLFGQLAGNIEFDSTEMETNVLGVMRNSSHIFNRSAGQENMATLYRKTGNLNLELDHLEKSTLLIPMHNQSLPHWMEDRLVEVYRQTDQLDRGREHLRRLVGKFDESLVNRHPKRAFLRINLAKILLEMGNQGAEARRVLQEAQQILANHNGVPAHVTDEIAELLVAAAKASS